MTEIMKEVARFDELVKHKQNVVKYGMLFCEMLVDKGEIDEAKQLYLQLMMHDNSKLDGFEWKHLWKDEPQGFFELAKQQHWKTNAHHPEYYQSGKHNFMTNNCLMEMVADWYSRMQENGEQSFDEWLLKAKKRFNFSFMVWNRVMHYATVIIELDRRRKREEGRKVYGT